MMWLLIVLVSVFFILLGFGLCKSASSMRKWEDTYQEEEIRKLKEKMNKNE